MWPLALASQMLCPSVLSHLSFNTVYTKLVYYPKGTSVPLLLLVPVKATTIPLGPPDVPGYWALAQIAGV